MEEFISHYMEVIAILLFAIGFSILLFNKKGKSCQFQGILYIAVHLGSGM